MALTNTQLSRLHRALLAAYTRDEMRLMLRVCMDVDFDRIVAEKPFEDQAWDLVNWTDRRGRAVELARCAGEAKPANQDMQDVKTESATWDATAAPSRRSRVLWFALVACVLAAIGVGAALRWWFTRVPSMAPAGSFNLAVAQFPVIDDNGRVINDCAGEQISNLLYARILDMPTAGEEQTLSDSRGPAQIGVIYAVESAARGRRVADLARELNATIVVHGVITRTAVGYELQPEFYVDPVNIAFRYAGEIAGPNRLGAPVSFTLPSGMDCAKLANQTLGDLDRQLDDRVLALRYILAGLRDFYSEQYALAYARFDEVANSDYWQSGAPGDEVVQLLMGAAQLRLYDPAGDPGAATRALLTAAEAFSTTIRLNRDYSRGYLGLGGVALAHAQIYDQQGINVVSVDGGWLTEAQKVYSQSVAAVDQPILAYVPIKAALGIGTAHMLGSVNHIAGWSAEEARRQLGVVTATLAAEQNTALLPLAAVAYGHLGQLAGADKDWAEMGRLVRQAIRLLEEPDIQPDHKLVARFWSWAALADENSGDLCAALVDYDRTLTYAGQGAPAQRTAWEAEKSRLETAANAKGLACGQ